MKFTEKSYIPVDFLFSYWIFAWFILYVAFFIKSSGGRSAAAVPNPKLALYLGIVENIVTFFILFLYKTPTIIIIKYLSMVFIAKFIPIYLLRNTKILWTRDVFATFLLFFIYLVWLYYNKTSLWEVYSKTFYSIVRGENKTPFFSILPF